MIRINHKFKYLLIFGSFCTLFLTHASFASTLADWKNTNAYKPRPVLFLHGFNNSPSIWSSAISELSKWFSKYEAIGSYLETMDFQDYLGSVDTYSDGRDGWADRLNYKINNLLSSNKYGKYTNKLNLVSHSMGGLAAREYLTNSKYPSGYIDKLILIGTPNLGSPLATIGQNIITSFKIGSLANLSTSVCFFNYRNNIDSIAKLIWVPNFKTLPALEDMSPGSNFLNALNNRTQPSGVEYDGIYGIIGNPSNWVISGSFNGGDGVVSKYSQLGTGKVFFSKDPREIKAFHTNEPALSIAGDNPLLQFLDSTKPVLEITSPSTSGIADIYGTSVRIQGKVYNEYLPADTKLIINVIEENSGKVVINNQQRPNAVKPSDLWIPNNPDSPVAEIDETINLPGSGKYKISCQLKNPAEQTSDRIEFFVNLTFTKGTNIIVHCHNPEGKEITSIQGVGQNSVEIYDGNTRIGYGAYNAETHNQPIAISSGTHTIKAKFNGMTKEQTLNLNSNETKVITFTFERTDWDFRSYLNGLGTKFSSNTESHTVEPGDDIENMDIKVDVNARTPPCIDQVVGCNLDNHSSVYPATWVITGWATMSISSSGVTSSVGFKYTCSSDNADSWIRINYPYSAHYLPRYVDCCNELKLVSFDFWFVQYKPSLTPTEKRAIFILQTPYCYLENSNTYKIHKIYRNDNGVEVLINKCPSVSGGGGSKGSAQSEEVSGNFYFDNCFVSSVPYDLLETGI